MCTVCFSIISRNCYCYAFFEIIAIIFNRYILFNIFAEIKSSNYWRSKVFFYNESFFRGITSVIYDFNNEYIFAIIIRLDVLCCERINIFISILCCKCRRRRSRSDTACVIITIHRYSN